MVPYSAWENIEGEIESLTKLVNNRNKQFWHLYRYWANISIFDGIGIGQVCCTSINFIVCTFCVYLVSFQVVKLKQ